MGIFKAPRQVQAFFIFHLRVGTRLAIRKLAPVLALIFAAYFILRPEFFHELSAGFVQAGFLMTGLISTIISLSIAGMASLRVCHGLDGWIRHLPAGSPTHRRLAIVSIFMAQLPILLVLAALALYSSIKFKAPATAYLTALPLLGLASAQCVIPVKRKMITSPLAVISCILLASGHWPFAFGGFILLLITDSISGPLSPVRSRSAFHLAFKGSLLHLTITWRAIRFRIVVPYLFSLLILGATALFLSNNNPGPLLAMKAVCFGGTLSVIVFLALVSNMIVVRRPPWPWVRSLPWSTQLRILIDALFLGSHATPLLILIALMNMRAVLPIVASLPLFALFTVSVTRHAPEYRMAASGKILLAGIFAALPISLIPAISLFLLALAPFALKFAVEGEQSQKVSRWLELYHLAEGDPLSWSK
ncbi:MAG: hypothetical protein JSV96_07255 [Candidatus Aminicenantes bacterium]|nr:MAG: hypothetical protein JSV96_07255 [Candidatus Aminicenantes bacterium]